MQIRHRIKLLGLTSLAASGLMAMSTSEAQAKYSVLLNGKSIVEITRRLTYLNHHISAENGLKINCTGGEGTATGKVLEGGLKISTSATGTLKGCVWVGSEKTCTINDGGVGLIKTSGSGEVTMPDASTYVERLSNANFATIFTEGVFCTIPEEEVLSGTVNMKILNPLEDTKVKLLDLTGGELVLGNSKVTEVAGETHVEDLNGDSTFAFHS